MTKSNIVLLLGDIAALFVGLLLGLVIRYGSHYEDQSVLDFFVRHLPSFSILFTVSIFVFFAAGLYEKQTLLFKKHLPQLLFKAQSINALIAILFFYALPFFGLTPKTTLFLYLVTSAVLIVLWRLYGYPFFSKRPFQKAILLGSGSELAELRDEIANNAIYGLTLQKVIDVSGVRESDYFSQLKEALHSSSVSVIISDEKVMSEEAVERALETNYRSVTILSFDHVYEEIFERVVLRGVSASEYIDQARTPTGRFDIFTKRVIDIILSALLLFLGVLFYPIIFLLVKIDDGGALFISQVRIGEGGKKFTVWKLRTMEKSTSKNATWIPEGKNRITRIGNILRRTSLDEIPQVLSVFKGDMSLIGPRADIEGLHERLLKDIPNYSLRTLVPPGLSGWAQIKQIYKKGNISPQSVEETALRLSYDLYYVKHRSVFLDIHIVFRTFSIFLSRIIA